MKVIIIAGGKGTRIASVTTEIPKAMIPINGKPVLEYQVELARRYGYLDIIIVIGHLGYQIEEYFIDGSKWGVNINYFKETVELGTAGALAYLKNDIDDDFFVFYGDTVMDINMEKMLDFHRKNNSDATLFIHPNDHPYDSDIVDIEVDGRIRKICVKPHLKDFISRNLVNAALFIFNPKILNYIELGVKSHIEKNVLPKCLDAGLNLFGYNSPEYIKDMGTPDRYATVCNDVISGKVARLNWSNKRPAVFLDRDGVISKEIDLLHKPDQLELIEGAAEAIKYINEKGYLVIVVTNQPVIARNLCTLDELEFIHAKLETMLGVQHAYLNAIYFCPHHPDGGYPEERKEYKIKCNCRKPEIGMFLSAIEDWNIDINNSIMIGDRQSDVHAGEKVGVKTALMIQQNKPNALLVAIKKLI